MLDQKLQLKLLQKLSPQQIQLIKLLEIPTMELEQRIKKEIEENPALEEGDPDQEIEIVDNEESDEVENFESDDDTEIENNDSKTDDEFGIEDYIADDDDETPYYNLTVNNYSKDDDSKDFVLSNSTTFHESLMSQLGLLSFTAKQVKIAEYLIGMLEDDGYLRRQLSSIVDDLAFLQNEETNEKEIEEILVNIIQSFDPPGIAARTLQECLLIQINRKDQKTKSVIIAKEILKNHFDDFTKKHYEKIIKKLSIIESDLKDAIHEILKLNPRPGNSISDVQNKNNIQITPDFILENTDGELYLQLNSKNAPELRISKQFSDVLSNLQSKSDQHIKTEKEAISFAKQKIESAKWFIDALQQRQNTLIVTMNAIIEYQRPFFIEGNEKLLKPMILKDIADVTGLDISTISRVANSKFIQTQHGIYSLKYFFSESMQNDLGEEVSTREIKKILQDEIEKEDKRNPLTDEELTEVLKENGYKIARRTVAKYREQLNIPVGRLRKEL